MSDNPYLDDVQRLQGAFSFVGPTPFALAPATPLPIAQSNPARWGIWIGCGTAVNIQVQPISSPAGVNGYTVIPGQPIFFSFADVGALVNQEWFAVAGAGGAIAMVTEVLLQP